MASLAHRRGLAQSKPSTIEEPASATAGDAGNRGWFPPKPSDHLIDARLRRSRLLVPEFQHVTTSGSPHPQRSSQIDEYAAGRRSEIARLADQCAWSAVKRLACSALASSVTC